MIELLSIASVEAQLTSNRIPHRLFHLSITPGFGTNGIQPGSYVNHFSLNLTSGYSLGNKGIEIGGISNLNVEITRGFQFAGLVNLTGGNAFAGMNNKEVQSKKLGGFEANLIGGQFAGILNLVENNVFGAQFSGLANISRNALFGLQIAGLSNTVKKFTFGVQIAGLSNSTVGAIDGIQISSLLNFTQGQLQGVQFGSINNAGFIEGKNSALAGSSTGLQVGLLNLAHKMNGFQIGLVNFGGQMQGTQIGLMNFYRSGKEVGTKDGTSIGLLNIGQTLNLKVFTDDFFYTNYSLITGNGKNFRIKSDRYTTYIMNEISLGYNPKLINNDGNSYGLGYGVNYMVFNRSPIPVMNEFRYLETGVSFKHYQDANVKLDRLNPIISIKVSYGSKLSYKLGGYYLFGAITFNKWFGSNELTTESIVPKPTDANNWMGYQVGLLIH